MIYTKSLEKILRLEDKAPSLSPVYDPMKSDCIVLTGAHNFQKLFSGKFLGRSPASITKKGLLQEFVEKSCMLKVKADIFRGFDISMALYPSELELAAWGIVIDRVGRVYQADLEQQHYVELAYQYGACSGRKDWERIVAKWDPNEEERVRRFYGKLRVMSAKRIKIAGTVGFGLWDALWMSFDLKTAYQILDNHVDFLQDFLDYWLQFHLSSIRGMLAAGIEIVFIRENPTGFFNFGPSAELMNKRLGPFYSRITKAVTDNGGLIFLDCDTDDAISMDYPLEWGFNGIGPMLFRDDDELSQAREILSPELTLIGYTSFSESESNYLRLNSESRPEFVSSGWKPS